MFVSADSAARSAEEVVRPCWTLIARGLPFEALDRAERALRIYDPPADSLMSGRLLLVIGVALQALGSWEAAGRYLADASWALERARAAGEIGAVPWRAKSHEGERHAAVVPARDPKRRRSKRLTPREPRA